MIRGRSPRHSFDLNGTHYESLSQCIRITGLPVKEIRDKRTNLKIIKELEAFTPIEPVRTETVSMKQKKQHERKVKIEEREEAKKLDAVDDWFDGI